MVIAKNLVLPHISFKHLHALSQLSRDLDVLLADEALEFVVLRA